MGEAAESKKSRGPCSTLHSWMDELSNQNKERETLELSLSLRRGSLKNIVQREGKALCCQQLHALSWLLRRFFPSTMQGKGAPRSYRECPCIHQQWLPPGKVLYETLIHLCGLWHWWYFANYCRRMNNKEKGIM